MLFPDNNLSIVRFDFTFEAGSCHQPHFLVAGAANSLFTEGTCHHSMQELAEFIDFRGISIDRSIDTSVGYLTVYTLRKYADELMPLMAEMFREPAFSQYEFELYRARRKQQIATQMQKPSFRARLAFYEQLFGFDHPLGGYATVADADALSLDEVRQFFADRYRLPEAHLILSGGYDDALLHRYQEIFGVDPTDTQPLQSYRFTSVARPVPHVKPGRVNLHLPNESTRQSSLRLGRVLPMRWDEMDYTRFVVLNTVLGGYFGSRLMTNIREDKGYTYGIYSQTQIYRDCIVFYITADVAAEHTDDALREIHVELDRLCQTPVGDEELERVRSYMRGDYLRSIDGIFEQAEKHRQMHATCVDDRFTHNLLQAIEETTPEQIQTLAQRCFKELTVVTVGAE